MQSEKCMVRKDRVEARRALGAQMQAEGVQFVLLQFSDIAGHVKQVTIPSALWTKVSDHGHWFDGSSIYGFARTLESDMYLVPDPDTYALVPWELEDGPRTARVICDIYLPNGEPFAGDPRNVLRRQMDRARRMGFEYNVAPELEFYFFQPHADGSIQPLQTLDQAGYFDVSLDVKQHVRREVVETLAPLGVTVGSFHHELGAGQNELDLKYGPGLTMADGTATLRIVAKTIAHQHGLFCSFMPKPITGMAGSGMHVHQSLLDPQTGENLMYDPNHGYKLSQTALQFIAGQLEHAKGMSVVVAPLVNSYKRLVSGFEAPVNICWGRTTRSALIRVPHLTQDRKASTRIELRCPDPSANPYLAFAVMLAAGLDGIERKLEPPAPLEEDLFSLSTRRMNYDTLPDSMGQAIAALRDSAVIADALGQHLFETYVEAKTQEWRDYRSHVTAWELNHYLATH